MLNELSLAACEKLEKWKVGLGSGTRGFVVVVVISIDVSSEPKNNLSISAVVPP